MVRTHILKAIGEFRDSLLERENTRTSESKLTFNIAYYISFQNVRSILEELQILLAPDKEHKKACEEAFEIQSGPLECNLEKVLYLLRCKICDDTSYAMLEKLKQSFVFGLIIIKVNTDLFKKENRMRHRSVFIQTMFKSATEVLMIGK